MAAGSAREESGLRRNDACRRHAESRIGARVCGQVAAGRVKKQLERIAVDYSAVWVLRSLVGGQVRDGLHRPAPERQTNKMSEMGACIAESGSPGRICRPPPLDRMRRPRC